jgi:hypothetical protein
MSRPLLIVESGSQVHYYEPRTATVWISHSNTWQRPDDPIYHCIGPWQQLEPVREGDMERGGWRVETTCGALTSSASWLRTPGTHDSHDYRHNQNGLQVPIRWAMQFARPCRRCWP